MFVNAELVVDKVADLKDKQAVKKAIKSAVMSKQYGNEDFLADLIADACSKFPVVCFVTVNKIISIYCSSHV